MRCHAGYAAAACFTLQRDYADALRAMPYAAADAAAHDDCCYSMLHYVAPLMAAAADDARYATQRTMLLQRVKHALFFIAPAAILPCRADMPLQLYATPRDDVAAIDYSAPLRDMLIYAMRLIPPFSLPAIFHAVLHFRAAIKIMALCRAAMAR